MNNKLVISFWVIQLCAVSFLAVQNFELNKKVDELSAQNKKTNTTQATETKPAKPEEASPFDLPHTDQLADQKAGDQTPMQQFTSIQFEETVHDFGRINEGEPAHTVFKFTNTGKFPLLISNAQPSCGCTVPNWSRAPVKPGEKGIITVAFDSHGKRGETEKTVTVSANTNPTNTVLTIKSTVIPKDK